MPSKQKHIEQKYWLDSKSVRGALVTVFPVLVLVLKSFGLEVGDGEQQAIIDGVSAVVGLAGTVFAIYGRVKANGSLRFK